MGAIGCSCNGIPAGGHDTECIVAGSGISAEILAELVIDRNGFASGGESEFIAPLRLVVGRTVGFHTDGVGCGRSQVGECDGVGVDDGVNAVNLDSPFSFFAAGGPANFSGSEGDGRSGQVGRFRTGGGGFHNYFVQLYSITIVFNAFEGDLVGSGRVGQGHGFLRKIFVIAGIIGQQRPSIGWAGTVIYVQLFIIGVVPIIIFSLFVIE